MPKDIFAGIQRDGDSLTDDTSFEKASEEKELELFAEQDKQEEAPAESQTEEAKEDETESPSQEGEDAESPEDSEDDSEESKGEKDSDNTPTEENTPFHKRWAKREEKLRKELTEQFEEKLNEVKGSDSPKAKDESDLDLPQWWVTLAGDDDVSKEAYSQFLKGNNQTREEIKKEVIEEQIRMEKQQKAEVEKWNNWVEDELGKLKDDGKKFDKNKLIKVALDYQPTDATGNISLEKAYDIYNMLEGVNKKDTKTAKKKEIISENKSTATPDTPPITMQNIRRKSWSDIAG